MQKSINTKKSLSFIVSWALLINISLAYFSYCQIKDISKINKLWESITHSSITNASTLAEIERELGYSGFIHHFKNYIIRREERYFFQAQQHYKQAKLLFNKLRQSVINPSNLDDISIIEVKLEEYYQNLLFSHQHHELSAQALDKLIKIDDNEAHASFINLKNSFLPVLSSFTKTTDRLVIEHKNNTYLATSILIPLLFISTFFSIWTSQTLLET